MSREKEANRVIEKRSVYYKDIISGLSCATNREAIIIFIILVKGDFKALFLINISVGRRNKKLMVPALLDIECHLSIVIDY